MVPSIASKKETVLLNYIRKDIWDYYNFNIIELFVFDRFFNWAISGNMQYIKINENCFYLFDYKYIAPSWGMSIIYLKKLMLHLSGSIPSNISTNLKYPLIRYTIKNEYKKWKSYYGFEFGTIKTLIAWDSLSKDRRIYLENYMRVQKLINYKGPKEKNKHSRPYNENVYNIFIKLLDIKENDKFLFTRHEIPTSKYNYTNTFKTFQDILYTLYEGRFLTAYSLNNLAEWFKIKYSYYLENKVIENKIRECKGSWKKIEELFLLAAKNYSLWFNKNIEIQNKDKLPRSIINWIYFSNEQISMFYVCLIKSPTIMREANAEKIFNSISEKYRNIFIDLYKNSYDGFVFWSKIKNIINWYKKNKKVFIEKDSNCLYWFQSLEYFLLDYKKWLLEFTDKKIYIKNIGINNATWNCYINEKCKKHGINNKIFFKDSI